jgi:hypothetical protein
MLAGMQTAIQSNHATPEAPLASRAARDFGGPIQMSGHFRDYRRAFEVATAHVGEIGPLDRIRRAPRGGSPGVGPEGAEAQDGNSRPAFGKIRAAATSLFRYPDSSAK